MIATPIVGVAHYKIADLIKIVIKELSVTKILTLSPLKHLGWWWVELLYCSLTPFRSITNKEVGIGSHTHC